MVQEASAEWYQIILCGEITLSTKNKRKWKVTSSYLLCAVHGPDPLRDLLQILGVFCIHLWTGKWTYDHKEESKWQKFNMLLALTFWIFLVNSKKWPINFNLQITQQKIPSNNNTYHNHKEQMWKRLYREEVKAKRMNCKCEV